MHQTNGSQQRVHLELDRKGLVYALVSCNHHFKERSDHAVRLRLVELFGELRDTLRGSGAVFHFDHLRIDARSIIVSLPAAELKLFAAFLKERQFSLKALKKASHFERKSVAAGKDQFYAEVSMIDRDTGYSTTQTVNR